MPLARIKFAPSHIFVVEEQTLDVPIWVKDLKSFRKWFYSSQVPEHGPRICYLHGKVWVDMSKEQLFTHVEVKTEFSSVLKPLARKEKKGRYFGDGVQITNVPAGLSAQPDGTFIAADAVSAGRVKLVEGAHEGMIELEGTPDMVLEVVSASSVKKDLETLVDLYWRAAIPEYWVVDVRQGNLVFIINRHTPEGYVAVRPRAGWLRSAVFGHAFRLTRQDDSQGNPEYSLDVR